MAVTDAAFHMTREQIEAFLAPPRHAVVAALRRDGAPQLSPIWYLCDNDRLYFSIFVESAKYRQLRRDPRIALCIDGGHPDARAVMIYGTAELIEDESPWREDLEWRLLCRYHATEEEARRYREETAGQGRGALVVVTPERIVGRDYN
jgi:PPOX class probable F420-dependent enzyme